MMGDKAFDHPDFLARLRDGDSEAYRQLIRRYHGSLVGVASGIIGSRAQAEEVVQDAWLAVFSGIGKFEGRSSVTSWLFAIVLNRARTRISRESRLVALPPVLEGAQGDERAVDARQFAPDGHWKEAPKLWDELDPERVIGGRQLWDYVQDVIAKLPSGQRAVIIMRDIEAREAPETCELLGISAENQRVLLHRARGRVRQAIDTLLTAPGSVEARKAPRRGARAPAQRRGVLRGVVPRISMVFARLAGSVGGGFVCARNGVVDTLAAALL